MMDLIEELNRIIHRHPGNATSENTILLDSLLHHSQGNVSSDGDSHLVRSVAEMVFLVLAYSVVIACALVGNSLVCHVIYKHKRLHTVTNLFIINLSVSDVLIAVFNIPFNLVRHVMADWPFGWFVCGMANFVLMVGVYVSTFTMAAISLDRYIVIVYPLRPRMTMRTGVALLAVTWAVGAFMSLPFVIYARVEKVELFLHSSVRCRLAYPDPADRYEQGVTMTTVVTQYMLPMTIIAVAYGRIARKLWARPLIGQPTLTQSLLHCKMKQKTIKMLVVIVVIFCLCWMPLNLYHVLTDLHPDSEVFIYNSTVYLVCHWLAMSSVCYNPFIYFWFNDYFRAHIKSWFSCCYRRSTRIHPGTERDGILVRLDRLEHRRSPANSILIGRKTTRSSVVGRGVSGGKSEAGPGEGGVGSRRPGAGDSHNAPTADKQCPREAAPCAPLAAAPAAGPGEVQSGATLEMVRLCAVTSDPPSDDHCISDEKRRALTEHYFKANSAGEKEF